MKAKFENNGSVFLIVIFVIAFLSALVIGIAQMNTEEIQLMRNQIYAADALAIAEAGLNDAFAKIREYGLALPPLIFILPTSFNGGTYTVEFEPPLPLFDREPNIISTGTSSQNFVARVKADITIGDTSPYTIRVDNLRINE